MSEPTFGMTFTRRDDEPRPVIASDMSVIGIVGTAPDADAATFPLNEPVEVRTNDAALMTGLGAAGTLLDDVTTVFGEGGSFVIVNRVEHDDDAATLQANLIGGAVARTGLYAALQNDARAFHFRDDLRLRAAGLIKRLTGRAGEGPPRRSIGPRG